MITFKQTVRACRCIHEKFLSSKCQGKIIVVRTRNKSSICGKIRGDDQEENVEYKITIFYNFVLYRVTVFFIFIVFK